MLQPPRSLPTLGKNTSPYHPQPNKQVYECNLKHSTSGNPAALSSSGLRRVTPTHPPTSSARKLPPHDAASAPITASVILVLPCSDSHCKPVHPQISSTTPASVICGTHVRLTLVNARHLANAARPRSVTRRAPHTSKCCKCCGGMVCMYLRMHHNRHGLKSCHSSVVCTPITSQQSSCIPAAVTMQSTMHHQCPHLHTVIVFLAHGNGCQWLDMRYATLPGIV